ncbi:MAG TPA: DUF4350 domain-containing protein [Streptomyces sp.]|nr:DUF4350 domain-containing protein [Streptomyces sp.]
MTRTRTTATTATTEASDSAGATGVAGAAGDPGASGTPHTGTSGDAAAPVTARRLWTRHRGLLLALVVLTLAGVALAVLRSGEQHGDLDPRSADRYGSRAVAELLSERGVTSRVVTTTGEAIAALRPGSTLLVTEPDLLTDRQQTLLHDAATTAAGRTVLVAPGRASTGTLAPGVRTAGRTDVTLRSPDCRLPAARRAGDVEIGGLRYTADAPEADTCYLSGDHSSLVRLPRAAGGDTVLLGSPHILYNSHLAERGNASLALQLLGPHRQLVWYLPSLGDTAAADGGDSDFFDLLPEGWSWAAAQLAIAAVLAALWRARRLGPLSAEPLPVAVRASEATEGRARLYHRAHARDRAADSLRSAARGRLAPSVGVPAAHAHRPDILCAAVAAHVPDSVPEVVSLLFGPVPSDDAALVRLAGRLDGLERRVTAGTAPPSAAPSTAPHPTERDSTS